MKTNFSQKPRSTIELEVTLDQKEFEPYWNEAYQTALSQVQLKGFRPGAAPKELAEQAIDKDKVFENAARQAVSSSLNEITKENNWTLVDAPKIDLQDSANGIKYKTLLTIFPEIKLGNYKKIAKNVLAEKRPVAITPEEENKTLDWLRNSRAKITRVERPARPGDLMDIDVASAADSFKGDRFVLGQSHFMPGFQDNLANHQAGETVKFSLKAPENYWNEKLRGQTIDFSVKINGVFEREVPELTDQFAQGLGPNFKTTEDLKKSIHDGLAQEKENKENERLRLKMLDEIIKASQMDIPEIMVQKTLDNMAQNYAPLMKKMGKSDEDIKKDLTARAKNNVASNFVIYKIAEVEKLQPTPEEVGIDDEKNYNYNYSVVLNEKVFRFLEAQKII